MSSPLAKRWSDNLKNAPDDTYRDNKIARQIKDFEMMADQEQGYANAATVSAHRDSVAPYTKHRNVPSAPLTRS